MSRIGKNPITIPEGVDVSVSDNIITIKGAKGVLTQEVHQHVSVAVEDGAIVVKVQDPTQKQQKALWGLFGSLVRNMMEGVRNGFEKKLEVNGVGYKVAISGNKVTLNVGYSHPVEFMLPEGVAGVVEGNELTLTGIDKQLVGQVAADIRKIRKPEPYKGKGIKYSEEIIIRKAGKAASKA